MDSSPDSLTEKVEAIHRILRQEMAEPKTELNYRNGYELAVAVVLSAQCTDQRVNLVTPGFFEAFPGFEALAQAEVEAIFERIRSITFPNNKSRNLKQLGLRVMTEHGGELPRTVAELEALPGIGRKTANVIASVLYGTPTMPVDTHVLRVSNRLGLIDTKSALIAERELLSIVPEALLIDMHHLLILHGRYTCKARKPLCDRCRIRHLCPWAAKHAPAEPAA